MKFLFLAIYFLLYSCPLNYAQSEADSSKVIEESLLSLKDSIRSYQLKEIEIASMKYETQLKNISIPIEISDENEIFNSSGSTPSDILKDEAGLALSSDGVWGTQITIRGLNKNNIVTLIDGNRIETANDIAAGLSLLDVNEIKKIEVIKSAASSLYGSGALGGVINIITKNGFYPEVLKMNFSTISSYNTVNRNGSGSMSLNLGNTNWFINFAGTLRSADDTRTPDGILKNSQYRNNNYSFFSGVKFLDNQEIKFSYQNYLAEDVGIPGNSLFTSNAEVKYLKAERTLSSFEYNIKNLFPSLIKVHTKIFYQVIDREVENKPHQVNLSNNGTTRTSVLKILPDGNHKTIGAALQSDWLFGHHFIITGFEAWQRKLITSRERELLIETIDTNSQSVINSVSKTIGEKPIPDSKYLSLGFFVQDEFEIIKDNLKITLGGRIDHIQIQNKEVYNPLYDITNGTLNNNPANKKLIWNKEEADDISWSGNISFLYSINKDIDLTFTAARSFRSPSLEERYQYIDLGSFVRLGSPDLQPEQGYFFDMGLRVWKNSLTFTGNMFLNFLNNLVSEEPGTFEGRNAFIKTNIGKARLYGFDFGLQYNFFSNYSLSGILSYVNGSDIESHTYLPQIPPLNGRIIFSFIPIEYFQIGLSAGFFADQNKTAPLEIKTPGHVTYDLQISSSTLNIGLSTLQIVSGIDNITDKSYRNHLSSFRGLIISEPGRNYFIKVKVDL